jgi:hypothetical protein
MSARRQSELNAQRTHGRACHCQIRRDLVFARARETHKRTRQGNRFVRGA